VGAIVGNHRWGGAQGLIAFYAAPFSASVVVAATMFGFWGGKAPPTPGVH
jgi:hypothetical protein